MAKTPKSLVVVGELVDLVAEAYGLTASKVVTEIAQMTLGPKGEDGDPTRATILSYAKEPTTVTKDGKTVARRNRGTVMHYKFAHLVINYLDGRRPGEPSVAVDRSLEDKPEWRKARNICKVVLEQERAWRFERPLGNDPGTHSTVQRLVGAYAISRRESSDGQYHQELLILRNNGSKKAPRCHCTFVTRHAVGRGEWMLAGNTVHCSFTGLREDNSHEIGSIYMAHHSGHDLLTGFVAGAGTHSKIPVAMPVVAVRVRDASNEVLDLGDLGDEAIMRAFRGVRSNIEANTAKLEEIIEGQLKPVVFQSSICNPAIRHAFEDGQLLVDPQFKEFCLSNIR